MPYPVLLAAGAALSAAGAGASIAANSAASSAMDEARRQEMARQRGYQDEAQRTVTKAIDQSGGKKSLPDLSRAQQTREAQYARLEAVPVAQPASAGGANDRVLGEATRRQDAGGAWQNLLRTNAAKSAGYGRWTQGRNINLQRSGTKIGMVNSFARGSAGVLPLEMEAAQHSADDLRAAGMGLSLAGSVAGGAGAMGYGPMWGAGTAATGAGRALDGATAAQLLSMWGQLA